MTLNLAKKKIHHLQKDISSHLVRKQRTRIRDLIKFTICYIKPGNFNGDN
jgi:hypothetical protein